MSRSSNNGEIRRSIPAVAGIGLRAPHQQRVRLEHPAIPWLEVHSENYLTMAGMPFDALLAIREHYPVSLHGVGLSLGSVDALNRVHLQKLKQLVDCVQPGLVSEHLAWSSCEGHYLNDLLPLPYTEEALQHVVRRIQQTQEFLGRELLIENISSYLEFTASTMPEWEFLTEVARRSGCRLLLDVNNVYVSACNCDLDPLRYLDAVPAELIAEIHLAGFTVKNLPHRDLIIDTHNAPVAPEVWALYGNLIARIGPRPTLIEWDSELPVLDVLLAEAEKAQRFLEVDHALVA